MSDPTSSAGPATHATLEAETDAMAHRFAERASDGSFSGRRGLYEHHERVLRQARARLALFNAASAVKH